MEKIWVKWSSLSLLMFPVFVMAQDVSIGLGVMGRDGLYKGENAQILPVPMVRMESGRFYLKNTELGIHLLDKQSNHVLDVKVFYSPFSFDPDDSDDEAIKKLFKRKSTAMFGLEYQYKINGGKAGLANLEVSGDILSESDSLVVKAGYSYPIFVTPKFRITPSLGISWYNKKHNDYYYGVSDAETLLSGIESYNVGSSVEPSIGFSAHYKIDPHWSVMGMVKHTFLSSKIKDSPIVDKSSATMGLVGVQYLF